MPHARLCFWIPLGVAVASLAALVALGSNGWPGVVGAVGDRFCESPRPGPIQQPANTFSNAGFVLVGLWIGWQASRDVAARKAPSWRNWMVSSVFFPTSLAVCSILIGIGSASLHASATRWGAELDLLSMHVWGAWMIAFATVRMLRLGDREFVSLWSTLVGGLATRLVWGEPYTVQGSTLFGSMIATAIGIEVVGRWRNRRRQRMDNHYLVWSVALFLTAYGFYLTSGSSGLLCDPDSFWQGHAAWHLLCAGATVFVYLYGRSERGITAVCDGPAPHRRAPRKKRSPARA